MRHITVLLKEAIELINPRSEGWWIDGTVGGGGHTRALLEATAPNGKVLGIDRDSDILTRTAVTLKEFKDRLVFKQGNYSEMEKLANECGVSQVKGVLMDLGVSSFQLDDVHRGFSFQTEGPLDMRMDQEQLTTAETLVNHADEKTLSDIFYKYGEERRSRKLANYIVRQRPVKDTAHLAEIAKRAVGRSGKIHPATRAFQALRIAVNDELGSLERGLEGAEKILADQGRLVVISFHSLEDRIVKHWMRRDGWERLTKKILIPGDEEMFINPRSRSAKCRAARRIRN